MKKIQRKKINKLYEIIGRLTTYIATYFLIEFIAYKILLYIVTNCITTIK